MFILQYIFLLFFPPFQLSTLRFLSLSLLAGCNKIETHKWHIDLFFSK